MNTILKTLFLVLAIAISQLTTAQFQFTQLSFPKGIYPTFPEYLSILDDTVYMIAYDGQGDKEIAKSDGKTPGTTRTAMRIDGHKIDPYSMYATASKIIFWGEEEIVFDEYCFQYNSATGEITRLDLGSSTFMTFAAGKNGVYRDNKGDVYFLATNSNKVELWLTDNSDKGAHLVYEFTKIPISTFYNGYMAFDGDILYYVGSDANLGYELFKTDLTTGTTVLLKDTNPAKNTQVNESPDRLYVYENRLYFNAFGSQQTGKELWVSDGTSSGTKMVDDMYLGPFGSNPANFFGYKGKLYFTAAGQLKDSTARGNEFYVYDPVAETYSMLYDIFPGTGNGADPGQIWVNENNELLLSGTDSMNGRRGIWRSDGTTAGTYDWIHASHYGTNAMSIYGLDFQKGIIIDQYPNAFYFSYDNSTIINIEDPNIPNIGEAIGPITRMDKIDLCILNIPSKGNLLYRIDLPHPDLGPDFTNCPGTDFKLQSEYDPASFKHAWSDGSTNYRLISGKAGIYWLDLFSIDYSVYYGRDSIYVDEEDINFTLGKDTALLLPGVLRFNFIGSYFWSTGSTDSFIVVTKPGNYWLHFTSEMGCIYNDTIAISALTSLGDISAKDPFLYPNPIHNGQTLQVKVEEGQILKSIQIYGIEGKKMFEAQSESGSLTLELPALAPGNYFVELELVSGKKSIARLSILP